jgi:hypothetical protein
MLSFQISNRKGKVNTIIVFQAQIGFFRLGRRYSVQPLKGYAKSIGRIIAVFIGNIYNLRIGVPQLCQSACEFSPADIFRQRYACRQNEKTLEQSDGRKRNSAYFVIAYITVQISVDITDSLI